MEITRIDYWSEEGDEADIYLCDGKNEFVTFCHPFSNKFKTGDSISTNLSVFNCSEPIISNNEICFIKRINNTYKHNINAKIINLTKGIVQVGNVIIENVGPFPGDLIKGNIVEFNCSRLDI